MARYGSYRVITVVFGETPVVSTVDFISEVEAEDFIRRYVAAMTVNNMQRGTAVRINRENSSG